MKFKVFSEEEFYDFFDPKIFYTEIIQKYMKYYKCDYEVKEDKFSPIKNDKLTTLFKKDIDNFKKHRNLRIWGYDFVSNFFFRLIMINFINDKKIKFKDIINKKIIESDSVMNYVSGGKYLETLFIFNKHDIIFVNFQIRCSIFYRNKFLGIIYYKKEKIIYFIPRYPADNILNLEYNKNFDQIISEQYFFDLVKYLKKFTFNQIFLKPKFFIGNEIKNFNGNLDHYLYDFKLVFMLFFLLDLEKNIDYIRGIEMKWPQNDLNKWMQYFKSINIPYNNNLPKIDEVCVNLNSCMDRNPNHYIVEEKIFKSIFKKDLIKDNSKFTVIIYVKKNNRRNISNVDESLIIIINYLQEKYENLKIILTGVHCYENDNLNVEFKGDKLNGLNFEYEKFNELYNYLVKNSSCHNIELVNGCNMETYFEKCYNANLFIGQSGGNIGFHLCQVLNMKGIVIDKLGYYGNIFDHLASSYHNYYEKIFFPIMEPLDSNEVQDILKDVTEEEYRKINSEDIEKIKKCIDKVSELYNEN